VGTQQRPGIAWPKAGARTPRAELQHLGWRATAASLPAQQLSSELGHLQTPKPLWAITQARESQVLALLPSWPPVSPPVWTAPTTSKTSPSGLTWASRMRSPLGLTIPHVTNKSTALAARTLPGSIRPARAAGTPRETPLGPAGRSQWKAKAAGSP